MTNTSITLLDYGTDLSSRSTGTTVRTLALRQLAHDTTPVTIDCTGIRTLSESFADELFGILVAEHGKAWFRSHVQVVGMTESTRGAILRAIDTRLHPPPAE